MTTNNIEMLTRSRGGGSTNRINPSTRKRATGLEQGFRCFVAAAAICIALSSSSGPLFAQATAPASSSLTVTLLGTGTPVPLSDRFGPSTLVEAVGRKLLFDVGRGASIRLDQLGINLGSIDIVFITHFHSDHLNGLPDLWMTGYIPVGFGNRSKPLRLVGPKGTQHIATSMRAMASEDIRTRMADEHVQEETTRIDVQEFSDDGVILDEAGLRVTAFHVNHGELIHPAFGYRIDYAGHSVLISGDTKYEPNIIKNGKDLDLLVHEVCAVPEALQNLPNIKQVINHHTSPQEAGKIFVATKPKMAAYSHIALLGNRANPPLTASDVERQTRETYDGPLTVGEDLTRFVIGDQVTVTPWNVARRGY